jgi:hypothetical protein
MVRGVGEGGGQGTAGVPALVSVAVLLVTASGVFAELQGALNVIWKAEPKAVTVSPTCCGRGRSALAWWRQPASCCWSRC